VLRLDEQRDDSRGLRLDASDVVTRKSTTIPGVLDEVCEHLDFGAEDPA